MKAEIISIGDELLIGQVVNSNASFIASQLHAEGIDTTRITVVPDSSEDIKRALATALERSEVVIMTGGLGPTKDDITKKSIAEFFHAELIPHKPTLEHIKKLFHHRSRPLKQVHTDQALVPEGATVLPNPFGTAPGIWMEKDGKVAISLPGVPYEMEAITTGSLIPRLLQMNDTSYTYHQTVLTTGAGESYIAELIEDWESQLPPHFKLAYLPQPGIVRLRISAFGNDKKELHDEVEEQIKKLEKVIPRLIFGRGVTTLEAETGKILRAKNLTLATAESCTGGYIAHLITSIAGSSDYFKGSVVAYDNDVKEQQLGVSHQTLLKYGAVSEEVVKEMAEGVKNLLGTDYALSTSGIAGPGGGTPEKPVGTVWIGLAGPDGTTARKVTFGDHRIRNIRRSALMALNLLRLQIIG
jgi:nicotinamide-nucleotide amidase